MKDPSGKSSNHQGVIYIGIAASVLAAGALWYAFSIRSSRSSRNQYRDVDTTDDLDDTITTSTSATASTSGTRNQRDSATNNKYLEPEPTLSSVSQPSTPATPVASNVDNKNKNAKKSPTKTDKTKTTYTTDASSEAQKEVEAADKRGKVLFKAKKYMEAAECFTEALNIISTSSSSKSAEKAAAPAASTTSTSNVFDPNKSSMGKQYITVLNNRSAMYEKADLHELALADCDEILSTADANHDKARLRKLRIMEHMGRYRDALVEVCAVQLKFMRDNREALRLGIPVKPPIAQDKIDDLMSHIIPDEIDRVFNTLKDTPRNILPSDYTILQLLKSFSGYNSWMSVAAKELNSTLLTEKLNELGNEKSSSSYADAVVTGNDTLMDRAKLLLRRGRRYMYDGRYEDASKDFEESFSIVEHHKQGESDKINSGDADQSNKDHATILDGEYPRLLEWVGLCRHLRYDLKAALKCYEKCSDLEPTNAEILVKRAGVKMDDGKGEESLELFDMALGLQPHATDALLHRSNLLMLQQKPEEAKKDLQKCIELQPNHVLAQLRLATVYMGENSIDEARACLKKAQDLDPQSSEVHSYNGELHFAQGNFVEAKEEFEKSMQCEPKNPTPYVNAALALMSIPQDGSSGMPDVKQSLSLLEKSIIVDPMFHAAYVHLGQLKLSMATNLTDAKDVITLYDKGVKNCRSKEELRDIVSMKILTVAQVDAAHALGMETLNMQ